jgi:hypothetical protein
MTAGPPSGLLPSEPSCSASLRHLPGRNGRCGFQNEGRLKSVWAGPIRNKPLLTVVCLRRALPSPPGRTARGFWPFHFRFRAPKS